jgi:ammonia channel protein AmtB
VKLVIGIVRPEKANDVLEALETFAIALFMPLRATEREEAVGLDVVQHGEEAYATGEGAILVAS